jgi:Asp-tRNA(Asn)/Glu-tRNA(Gln) amidotransferase A subunit family amidase
MGSGPLTITAAAPLIRSGELTPRTLLEECLARIDAYEPAVQAWASLDRDGARQDADRLTDEIKRGQYRGPLHGIPIGVKDIIDVFDLRTGCGSKVWANSFARRDAPVVEQLRQAGAVILGKTVTTAYASFDPPVTRNPWNRERTPGGSSSGSAAAVACGMCLAALGTQTGGSITRPASYCGVASLKPTHGRVSLDGVLPLSPRLDHVGVMANSVADLLLLFRTIRVAPAEPTGLLHRLLDLTDFAPPGLPEPSMAAAFAACRDATAEKGWVWREHVLPPSFAEVRRNQYTLMAVGAAGYHGERFRRRPDDYPPWITKLIQHGLTCPAPEYDRVLRHHARFRAEIDAAFPDGWDCFATPATAGPAPAADTTGDPAFNSPWSYAGLPTVSLPIAWSDDRLPLSIQFVGRRGRDEQLLALAARFEADLGFEHRTLPL